MECPTCHSPMTEGERSMDVTLADFVMGGGGSSELRFHESEQKPLTILAMGKSRPGLTCQTCGHFLIITNLEFTDAQCVICRTLIPAGARSCPKCGWTYDVGVNDLGS
jgi:hypothetical protein